MKTENIVILVAFIMAVIVIFSFSPKSKEEEEILHTKSAVEQKTNFYQQEDAAELVEKLNNEKHALAARVKELEETLKRYEKKEMRNEKSNFFDTQEEDLSKTKSFGVYAPYLPYVKQFINYAKTHKVPAQAEKDLVNIFKNNPQITNIGYYSNMNVINFKDGFYVKMLQNMVAIYSPKAHYHIDFNLNGEATCVGKSSAGYKDCQRLGGEDGIPNKRIPFWIAYKLPQNIFAN